MSNENALSDLCLATLATTWCWAKPFCRLRGWRRRTAPGRSSRTTQTGKRSELERLEYKNWKSQIWWKGEDRSDCWNGKIELIAVSFKFDWKMRIKVMGVGVVFILWIQVLLIPVFLFKRIVYVDQCHLCIIYNLKKLWYLSTLQFYLNEIFFCEWEIHQGQSLL